MQVSACKDSKVAATTRNVRRVVIYPNAEHGAGVMALYGDQGETLALILLKSMDNVVLYDDPTLTPGLAALLPPPIVQGVTDEETTEGQGAGQESA